MIYSYPSPFTFPNHNVKSKSALIQSVETARGRLGVYNAWLILWKSGGYKPKNQDPSCHFRCTVLLLACGWALFHWVLMWQRKRAEASSPAPLGKTLLPPEGSTLTPSSKLNTSQTPDTIPLRLELQHGNLGETLQSTAETERARSTMIHNHSIRIKFKSKQN